MTNGRLTRLAAPLMAPESTEPLSNEAQLALAYTGPKSRGALTIFFEFDARLARIVAGTTEVMLGQMRLAWWRDMLSQPLDGRPQGDAVLDGIGSYWQGFESALVPLVDAWEWMLAEEFDTKSASEFALNRAKPLGALVQMVDECGDKPADLARKAAIWAYADAVANITDAKERETLLELARAEPWIGTRFPRGLRGIDVLIALSRRSLARGGRPLMEGRGAALIALRAAVFGR